jgi:polyhydroxybutyrate depolymerase
MTSITPGNRRPKYNQIVKLRAIFIAIVLLTLGLLTSSCERGQKTCVVFSTAPASEDLSPGNFTLTLGPQNDQREVILHLPPNYIPDGEFPLLLVLHGASQDGAAIQELTGMDAYADQYGFIVAYPNGSGRPGSVQLTWNAGHCCGYALENNVDDVGFLETVIDFFVSNYPVDAERVFLAGLSNGGMMAYRAGAELADKVAAIAPVAGSVGGKLVEGGPTILPDSPDSPVAVIAFHGLNDRRVLYEGGISTPEGAPAFIFPRADVSVAESIAFWVKANACSDPPSKETLKDGNVIIDRYERCRANTSVVLVTLVQGCHEWPTETTPLGRSTGACANRMMLEFFLAHPKQP